MKIALLGYGKMGHVIEKIALDRGHTILLRVNQSNAAQLTDEELKRVDVAIEFSKPQTAVANILRCLEVGVPVVVGTTGWLERLDEMKQVCIAKDGTFFHASNFSIGVNLFFRLNERLAQLMNGQSQYSVSLQEIHHIHKLDSPSGTALSLLNGVFENLETKSAWKEIHAGEESTLKENEVPVYAKREGEVPGTHSITYRSSVDQLTITHEAFSREGFALGAVLAAEWLPGKKGVLGMRDLLGF